MLSPSEFLIWQIRNQSLESCNIAKEKMLHYEVSRQRATCRLLITTIKQHIFPFVEDVLLCHSQIKDKPQMSGMLLAASPQLSKGIITVKRAALSSCSNFEVPIASKGQPIFRVPNRIG